MNTDITSNLSTPLSREELASYYTAANAATSEMYKSIASLMEKTFKEQSAEIMKVVNGFNSTIQDMKLEQQKSMIDLNNKMLNLFTTAADNQRELVGTITSSYEKGCKDVTKSVAELKKAQSLISDEIRHTGDMARKQVSAINNKKERKNSKNLLFNSLLTMGEQKAWVEMAKGDISRLFFEKKYNKGDIYRFIYGEMKKNKYDVDSLLEEYRKYYDQPNVTCLEMIAASDAMRECFMRQLMLYGSDKPSAEIKGANSDKDIVKINKIDNLVSKLSATGRAHGMAYGKAYKLLGIDINKYRAEARKRHNIKYPCSVANLISLDPDMINKLEAAINSYLGGEK